MVRWRNREISETTLRHGKRVVVRFWYTKSFFRNVTATVDNTLFQGVMVFLDADYIELALRNGFTSGRVHITDCDVTAVLT